MVTIFTGGIRPLPPDNQPTGFFKRHVHGGPEKALHQYSVGNYAKLAAAFPEAAALLVPGSIGENISASSWDETVIAVGDVFKLGDSIIQVSQPRSPCWKIDHRFSVEGMAQLIAEQRITGWYFRVLEEGTVEPGDDLERIGRNAEPVSIAGLLSLWAEHRPNPDRLIDVSRTLGLTASWVDKLEDRAGRLRQTAAEDTPTLLHPHPDAQTRQG